MSEYVDPVSGKRISEMNIVEWCDWEVRARHEFYQEKAQAKRDGKLFRRANRVAWNARLVEELRGVDVRIIAERIDQAYYPEAWAQERKRELT